jgi:hypothetical protein
MNPIDPVSLATAGLTPGVGAQLTPPSRDVSPASAEQFRARLDAGLDASLDPTRAQPSQSTPLASIGEQLDIEQVLMQNLPAANASPAEFAMGMLRAQVRVAQTAIAIEMVNKTTQSLSQGVQSLATRS